VEKAEAGEFYVDSTLALIIDLVWQGF